MAREKVLVGRTLAAPPLCEPNPPLCVIEQHHVVDEGREPDHALPVPHKDFSDLYDKMSGKGESASEAHL